MSGRSRRPWKRSRLDSKRWRCSKSWPAAIEDAECVVVTVFVFNYAGKEAQGALQEAFLLHHRHISNLYQRGHHQHSTSHRPLLYTQLLQWVLILPQAETNCSHMRVCSSEELFFNLLNSSPFSSAVQWRCRATSSTCSRLSRPPCRPARAGSPQPQRGQVTERPPPAICLFWTRATCSACSSSLIVVWLWRPPLPLHPLFFLSLFLLPA